MDIEAQGKIYRDARSGIFKVTFPGMPIQIYGCDISGATDSTAVIQKAIDANPGRTLQLPATLAGGCIKFSALTMSKGQTLCGVGWRDYRDRFTTIGTAGWSVNANFNGTVLRSTATSGSAITIVDSEVTEGGLSDFILIGPGSGTSTGVTIGSGSMSTVHPVVRNVKIGNFSKGMFTTNMDEGSFYDLTVHGCTTGLGLGAATNNNGFYGLDIQRNVTGCVISSTCYANAFYSPVGQSNTGSAFDVSGVTNAWYNPYLENNGAYGLDFQSGATGNSIDTAWLNSATDGVRFQVGADHNALRGGPGTVAAPIINLATGTYLQGRFPNLSDTGYGTIIEDPSLAGSPFSNWATYTPALGGTGWALGNGTATGSYTTIGRTTHFRGFIVFGTTTTYGAVSPTISVPYTLADRGDVQAFITRSGVNTYALVPKYATGGSTFTLWASGTNGAFTSVTSTVPATWAAGDAIEFAGTYERV